MTQLTQANMPDHKIQTDARFDNINRWTFMMLQTFEARNFLSLAESTHQVRQQSSMEEILTQQALFRSFILSYAKCFSSTGKGRMKLDPNKVYDQKANLLPTHERIMELRNKFAAHSDVSDLDEAVISVQELDDHYEIRNLYTLAIPLNEYGDYTKVLDELDNHIVIGINKALDSLEKKLGKKIMRRS